MKKPWRCYLGWHRWRVWAMQPRKAIILAQFANAATFRCCEACGKVSDNTYHWSGEATVAISGERER